MNIQDDLDPTALHASVTLQGEQHEQTIGLAALQSLYGLSVTP
jgi:hypothetical protein